MPLITGRLDQHRAIIDVGLQPTTALVFGVEPVAAATVINIKPLRGLIDTGAQLTCVTRSAAISAQLVPRGKKRVGNVSNVEYHTAYSFALGVWYSMDDGDITNETKGYYGFEPVLGCDFKDNNDFDILIGMDIISQGDFSTKRDGTFVWELP